MCREKQTLSVAQNLLINTFQVQVQPFGLSGDHFSAGKCRHRRRRVLKCLRALVPGVNPLLVSSSRRVSAGRRRHVDPHHRGRGAGQPGAHRAPGLPHWQEEEPRRLPDHLGTPLMFTPPPTTTPPLRGHRVALHT